MSISATPRVLSRRFPHFPGRMLSGYGAFTLMVAGGTILTMLCITIGVSFFRSIDYSGWDLWQQMLNWYALGICAHIGSRELWLYVAHGGTRRNFMGETAIFVAGFALLLALIYAAAFWIEAPLYAAMGWPQLPHNPMFFHHVLDSHWVVLEGLLSFGLWGAAGLLIGAAFYRDWRLGMVATGVAMFFAQITSLSVGDDAGPMGVLVRSEIVPGDFNIALAVVAHLACWVILAGATWLVIRDVPIHARAK